MVPRSSGPFTRDFTLPIVASRGGLLGVVLEEAGRLREGVPVVRIDDLSVMADFRFPDGGFLPRLILTHAERDGAQVIVLAGDGPDFAQVAV